MKIETGNNSSKRASHTYKLALFCAWFTLTAFTKEVAGLGGAIYADLLGVVIIVFGSKTILKFGNMMKYPDFVSFYLVWMVSLTVSCFVNYELQNWVTEYLKLVYLICLFLSFYTVGIGLRTRELKDYCLFVSIIYGALALIFLIDFAVVPLLGNYSVGGLVGGFRNTGQAGTFFSIGMLLVVCLYHIKAISGRVFLFSLIFQSIAILATQKRAAMLGLVVAGLSTYLIGAKKGGFIKRSFVVITLGTIISSGLFFIADWGLENIDGTEERLGRKFGTDFDGGGQDFLISQIMKTKDILTESPFFGAGASGSIGYLGSYYEVHNGYLKVFSISGLIGGFLYLCFYWKILANLYMSRKHYLSRGINSVATIAFPLFLGYSVAWGYTFPIRKREFWMFLAFIFVFLYLENRGENRERTGNEY